MSTPNQNMRSALHACASSVTAQPDGGWSRTYVLPGDGLMFAGHFPGQPVLPAVVQTLMAQMTVEEALGRPMRLAAVTQAKFTAVLPPDSPIALSVRPAKVAARWDCVLHSGATLAAKIQVQLEEVGA